MSTKNSLPNSSINDPYSPEAIKIQNEKKRQTDLYNLMVDNAALMDFLKKIKEFLFLKFILSKEKDKDEKKKPLIQSPVESEKLQEFYKLFQAKPNDQKQFDAIVQLYTLAMGIERYRYANEVVTLLAENNVLDTEKDKTFIQVIGNYIANMVSLDDAIQTLHDSGHSSHQAVSDALVESFGHESVMNEIREAEVSHARVLGNTTPETVSTSLLEEHRREAEKFATILSFAPSIKEKHSDMLDSTRCYVSTASMITRSYMNHRLNVSKIHASLPMQYRDSMSDITASTDSSFFKGKTREERDAMAANFTRTVSSMRLTPRGYPVSTPGRK